MDLKFRRDTALRKKYFTPESFSHPAIMAFPIVYY